MSASTDWRIISSCSNLISLESKKRLISGNYSLFDIYKRKIDPQKYKELCLLGSEVISSQFGVVNLEEDVGVADGGSIDLETETKVAKLKQRRIR